MGVVLTSLRLTVWTLVAFAILTVSAFAFFALIAVLMVFLIFALIAVTGFFMMIAVRDGDRRESVHSGEGKAKGD
jgi:hypothetical protein